ncbi:anhydro-N-acetylmuramic acid kinase [Pseudoruegeria sp. HB172150]|uniref:anhydro-N-acetylmuramic acid kinase n=1 Tax=Pseudoruegeria sp. HB172150 TaxID=2721164 RepID=UPI0015573561|nr:anhydro-N-acetylmuramic acid kinase [Pseudoruegeria sp. HB172150]
MKITGPVWALGTMSGTSLDGVDAAMVLTDGHRIHDFGETAYRPYSEAERAVIRAALGRWPGDDAVEEAAEVVENAHAELMAQFPDAQLAGFHGQTLAHDPGGHGTHQAGNGALLAEVLSIPVVWDFRSSDVQLGGEGAPLAPFYHFACARHIGATEPLAFLNLGGVGNLTWIDPSQPGPDTQSALLAFDTGPANAPLNDLMRIRLGKDRDDSGALASSGIPVKEVISRFLDHPYFHRIPPKSLDRDDFRSLSDQVSGLSDIDAAATLAACTVAAVIRGMEHCPSPPARLLVTGGGRHNAAMMNGLADTLPCPVEPVEAAGLDGDMLEAQAFAHLATRVASGLPTTCPGTTGVAAPVGGGRISYPQGMAALRQ